MVHWTRRIAKFVPCIRYRFHQSQLIDKVTAMVQKDGDEHRVILWGKWVFTIAPGSRGRGEALRQSMKLDWALGRHRARHIIQSETSEEAAPGRSWPKMSIFKDN